jgi:hypothetical protein
MVETTAYPKLLKTIRAHRGRTYLIWFFFFVYFFGGLECVGHSFAYVAHLWFLRDVRILILFDFMPHPKSYLFWDSPFNMRLVTAESAPNSNCGRCVEPFERTIFRLRKRLNKKNEARREKNWRPTIYIFAHTIYQK